VQTHLCLSSLVVIALAMTSLAQNTDKDKNTDAILQRFHAELIELTPGQGKFPASFMMGSKAGAAAEQPAHKVTLAKPFALAKYEVTQELYEVIAGKNPSRWKGRRNSVELVSWEEASAFCRKLTAALRARKLLGADQEIRLPSEAEWEYACRAGTTTAYSFGDDVNDLTHYAWYKGNSKGYDPPVGAKKANPWGLHDMHGYVWEWCADDWHPSYEGAPSDGSAWGDGKAKERVARGGAWSYSDADCRSAFRRAFAADTRSDAVGFRCVRAAVPAPRKGSEP
jgi:formylglycine-generating enzyme required for sulfatase activity